MKQVLNIWIIPDQIGLSMRIQWDILHTESETFISSWLFWNCDLYALAVAEIFLTYFSKWWTYILVTKAIVFMQILHVSCMSAFHSRSTLWVSDCILIMYKQCNFINIFALGSISKQHVFTYTSDLESLVFFLETFKSLFNHIITQRRIRSNSCLILDFIYKRKHDTYRI